jgi:hypothetical protein
MYVTISTSDLHQYTMFLDVVDARNKYHRSAQLAHTASQERSCCQGVSTTRDTYQHSAGDKYLSRCNVEHRVSGLSHLTLGQQ